MGELGRLHWSCRRGLLELDLILTRFLEHHLDEMDAQQRDILAQLLGYPDNDLLDWVMGREEPPDPRFRSVIQLLRAG